MIVTFHAARDPGTGYLSNFYRAPFWLGGRHWPTAEHAYQAQKTTDAAAQEAIRRAPKPREAKRLAQAVQPLRDDWDTHRMTAMLMALVSKFVQNPSLGERLRALSDRMLVETSPTDAFWGDGPDGTGQNRLGALLTTLARALQGITLDELHARRSAPETDALQHRLFHIVQSQHSAWWQPADAGRPGLAEGLRGPGAGYSSPDRSGGLQT